MRIPATKEYPDLPWQISRHAIVKLERACAFRAGEACVVISDPNAALVRVQGLLSAPEDHTACRDVLSAVISGFPDREFLAPPFWPAEFGETVFQSLGFAREPLSQLFMRLDL